RNPANNSLSDRPHSIGRVGDGAGDPAGVAVAKDGAVYVPLAGVGQGAIGGRDGNDFRTRPAGIRPTAMMVSPDGKEVYVADSFGDAIVIIAGPETARISLGPQPQLTAVERGERLFYDARLSHEHWMSCHSCHTDGHSSGSISDTLGDGSF